MQRVNPTDSTKHNIRNISNSADIEPAQHRPLRKKSGSSLRTLSAAGWLPNYHGAWAMISVPILLGVFSRGMRGLQWLDLLLLAFWWIGYFAFFAGALFLKTRFRRGFQPLCIYLGISAIAGLCLLILKPALAIWIPIFLPLVLISIWAAWTRRERGLRNDLATVTAACLMLPVAAHARSGVSALSALDISIWLATFIIGWYFLGTVFYVKTNIRKRNSAAWLTISGIFHAFGFLTAIYLFVTPEINAPAISNLVIIFLITLCAIIFFRSILVPLYGRWRKFPSAKTIGIGEFIISILLFCALFTYLSQIP
ncbi:YwiC-like family protein [Arcanobacterium hippocoleae]|uniref:YwiC-like family protein n=1 Tax=Arcanobacterium hippocoleae TaxID=149017 RepID=UPI003340D564